jgi:hypothetical protein
MRKRIANLAQRYKRVRRRQIELRRKRRPLAFSGSWRQIASTVTFSLDQL